MEQKKQIFWAARDYNGDLYLYNHKPIKKDRYIWSSDTKKHNNCTSCFFDDSETNIFSSIKITDEESTEIEITIKKK